MFELKIFTDPQKTQFLLHPDHITNAIKQQHQLYHIVTISAITTTSTYSNSYNDSSNENNSKIDNNNNNNNNNNCNES